MFAKSLIRRKVGDVKSTLANGLRLKFFLSCGYISQLNISLYVVVSYNGLEYFIIILCVANSWAKNTNCAVDHVFSYTLWWKICWTNGVCVCKAEDIFVSCELSKKTHTHLLNRIQKTWIVWYPVYFNLCACLPQVCKFTVSNNYLNSHTKAVRVTRG